MMLVLQHSTVSTLELKNYDLADIRMSDFGTFIA